MSLSAVLLVSFFFFSSLAVAQISAPPCSSDWNWSFNSLGQSPCLIVAYMMSTCNGGTFTVQALPPGQHYVGPSGQDDSNLCKCSTIAYSLISACDGCQGSTWITWSEFVTNCSKTEAPGAFPNAVPAGTSIPQWALFDVTNSNDWNANQSYAIGDSPEIGAGTILGPSGPSTSSSTGPTSSSTSSAAPIHSKSSNTGAIAGGVVGGIGAISILIGALFFYRRRGWGRKPALPTPSAIDERPNGFNSLMDQIPRSMSGPGTIASSLPDTTSLRPYDPDDPTTFPGYQGPGYQGPSPPPMYNPYSQTGHESPSGPSTSSGKNAYTIAPAARNSQGMGLGYSGLPEVAP